MEKNVMAAVLENVDGELSIKEQKMGTESECIKWLDEKKREYADERYSLHLIKPKSPA